MDGIFIARLVDTDALSAINITMPMIFLASAIGMMFGSGGNALVAKKLGEGKQREAQEDFSLLMAVAFIFSVVLAALCFAFLNPLCYFLGSDQVLLHYCAVFGMVFQLSFITVGKAGFGAALSVMGGVLNIVLDWLFVAIFHWGLAGGAVVDFFAKNNAQVETIALYGFRIVATSFLMMACNVFASGWFTALNDGKTSAILSFCRTVIFMIAPVLILPGIFGMDGVWMSITAGEVLSILMSIFYFRKYRNMWSVKV